MQGKHFQKKLPAFDTVETDIQQFYMGNSGLFTVKVLSNSEQLPLCLLLGKIEVL